MIENYPDILTVKTRNQSTNIKRLIRIYDWLKYCKKQKCV